MEIIVPTIHRLITAVELCHHREDDGAAVVAYARQFIGNPYVYGGNSLTNGIDCSGFTQQIYAAFGVSLPRADSAQALCGVEIPLSQAKAGRPFDVITVMLVYITDQAVLSMPLHQV